jgi:hypothetical protein
MKAKVFFGKAEHDPLPFREPKVYDFEALPREREAMGIPAPDGGTKDYFYQIERIVHRPENDEDKIEIIVSRIVPKTQG